MASSGNFCVWNPLNIGSGGSTTLSEGNLKCAMTGADPRTTGTLGGTIADSDGFYFETVATNIGDGALTLGIVNDDRNNLCKSGQIHSRSGSYMWRPFSSGQFFVETSTNTSYGAFANGDILGWFIKDSKLYVKKNNSDVVGDVSAGTGGISLSGTHFFPAVSRTVGGGSGIDCTLRPDSDSWSYTPPDGFKGLTSKDMNISDDIDPAQTDDDYPSKQFGVVTYTGNGGVLSVTGLGFKPDLVWGKMRSPHAYNNMLYDSSRGANRVLQSDTSNAEIDLTSSNVGLRTFDSDGFTLGSEASLNESGDSIVAWCWRANGGTTTSFSASGNQLAGTFQANTKSKFSIITYTGSGSTAEVLHGLGTTPNFIIYKARNDTHFWGVYHKSGGTVNTGDNSLLYLNSSNGLASNQNVNIAPDSTKIAFAGNEQLNRSSFNYVMYAWADVEGFQKFGTYVGNGNDDGPFIYLGFRPRLVAIKWLTGVNSAEDWGVFDTARSTTNPSSNDSTSQLQWNRNVVGSNTSAHKIDFLSNGFKLRGNGGLNNTSGATYIYMCWADVSFKYNNTF